MSDGAIRVTLEGVDNTGKAFSSATANVNKLEAATKKLGAASSASPASVMDKWTRSQYAAAQAGSLLTDKAIHLANAINTGKISTEQARKEYTAFEKQMKGNVWQAMTLGEKYGVVRQRIADMSTEAIKFGGAAVGVGLMAKGLYDVSKSGAQLEYTQVRFDRLSRSVGTTGDVFMEQLRAATRGTVSDMQLAKNAADLFQLGLARTSDEAVRLSKVQTALGMDTGELTLALANQSKRRLDQLGLSLTKFNEIEAKLKDRGMSKEDAFREAFMLTAEDTIRTTGNMADSGLGSYQRFEAGIQNLLNNAKMGIGAGLAPVVEDVGKFFSGIQGLQTGERVWDWNAPNGMLVRQGLLGDKLARQSSVFQQAATNMNFGDQAPEYQAGVNSGLLNYTAMAYAYRSGGGGGPQTAAAEVKPPDYTAMISGGVQLTKVSEDYSKSLSGINEKLAEQQALMDKYARYGETSKKYKEAKENAEQLKGAIQELEVAQDKQASAGILAMMQQDEAFDPQKAYDFAAATGQITKQAAEQYKAYTRIKDALGDNTLNADQAAYATRALTGDISALNGMTAKAWIDVYIRTHGTMIDFGLTGMTAEDWGNKRKVGGEVGFASGTTDIGRAGVFRVGEMGEEGLVVRRDGSVGVIPAGTWREMQKYGVGADGGYAMGTADAGGGGGMTPRGYAYLASRRSILPAPRSVGGGGAAAEEAVTRQEFYAIQKTMTDMAAILDKAIGKQSLTPSMDITQRSADRIGRSVAEHVNMRSG